MQTKLVRLALFLFFAAMAGAVNFYYGYLYESKIQKTISLKNTLADIAANSYLITESLNLLNDKELNAKPELKENVYGRLNLIKLNITLLQQQDFFNKQEDNYRTTEFDSLKDHLQNLELAMEVLAPRSENISDPLNRRVALSSAIREVSKLTDLAYSIEDGQNLKLNGYNNRLKFHTGLDAGIFISALFIAAVVFIYPEMKMNALLSAQISTLKKLQEKREKNIKILREDQHRLKQELTEAKKQLRIANYSLAKKNAAEYRAKQDFDHFVLLIGNRMAQPLQKLKETLNRLGEQLKSGKPEFAMQSVKSAYQKSTAINGILEAIQEMGKSLNTGSTWSSVYLGPLISEIIALYDNAQAPNIEVTQNLPEVKAPKEPLVYILSELLNNALIHNRSSSPQIRIDYALLSEMHAVSVTDNGDPLSEDTAKQLLSLFAADVDSHKSSAKGVGLTISRYLAQRIGGNLIFRATTNGNKFTFEWPAKT